MATGNALNVLSFRTWTVKLKPERVLAPFVRRILVVDDDRDSLISVSNALRAEFPHLDIRVAADAKHARSLADGGPFDLVLADARFQDALGMPALPLRKPVDTEQVVSLVRMAAR